MRMLYVLYDETCVFCVRCAEWLRTQPTFFPLVLLPAGGLETRQQFPDLKRGAEKQLVAIDDAGGVYRDSDAWLMCLYALEAYREWALRMARPTLRPLARHAFELLSNQRGRLVQLLGMTDEELMLNVQAGFGPAGSPLCGTNGRECELPSA